MLLYSPPSGRAQCFATGAARNPRHSAEHASEKDEPMAAKPVDRLRSMITDLERGARTLGDDIRKRAGGTKVSSDIESALRQLLMGLTNIAAQLEKAAGELRRYLEAGAKGGKRKTKARKATAGRAAAKPARKVKKAASAKAAGRASAKAPAAASKAPSRTSAKSSSKKASAKK
ncbi:MAG TPA: hypothetical protein VN634_19970 [Candidatus Limnocylindrales bacterium]|nr:hypothetical protein [Candidatus Limnocylindrales bacterium]